MADPKQHHYIPETYLENFCDSRGNLWLFDKWEGRSFPSRPGSVLKERFYYAQPDHANKTWNHGIENFFSKKVETKWPATVRLIQRGPENVRDLINLYMFMYALRVRVPSCRKSVEYALQQQVRIFAASIKDKDYLKSNKRIIKKINEVLNKNYKSMDELYEDGVIDITIDPHRSILAMADLAKGFSMVVSKLQLHFVKNRTAIDFNCSDNPIVYFPADHSPQQCAPYQFHPDRPFEFIFPITKQHCLYHNSLKPIQAEQIVLTETSDVEFVRKINRFVGAFADRYVVSSKEIEASELPTMNRCPRPVAYRLPQPRGTLLFLRYEMGKPLRLPKWTHKFENRDGK
jgi:hypothetical protein